MDYKFIDENNKDEKKRYEENIEVEKVEKTERGIW